MQYDTKKKQAQRLHPASFNPAKAYCGLDAGLMCQVGAALVVIRRKLSGCQHNTMMPFHLDWNVRLSDCGSHAHMHASPGQEASVEV
jgi:hypothetical protein